MRVLRGRGRWSKGVAKNAWMGGKLLRWALLRARFFSFYIGADRVSFLQGVLGGGVIGWRRAWNEDGARM